MAQTFPCPSCGAPVEPEVDQTTVHCKYCNESVIIPPELRTKSRVTPPAEPVDQPDQADFAVNIPLSSKKKSTWIWITIALILVVCSTFASFLPNFVSFDSVLSFMAGAKTATPAPTIKPVVHIQMTLTPTAVPEFLLGGVVPAPLGDSHPADFLVKARDDDGTQINRVVLVDGKKHTIIWRTDSLGEGWLDVKEFPTETQVFIANGTDLTALDRQTGKIKWKTTLDNGVDYWCATCLKQFLNTLVVVLKDGSLQGVDAVTGKLTWHKTLNKTDSDLLTVDGNPAVEDDTDKDRPVFYILDAFSGKVIHQYDLGCTDKDTEDSLGQFFMSDDGKSLFMFYDDCIKNVSLADGKVLSQVLTPAAGDGGDGWPKDWSNASIKMNQGIMYYADYSDDTIYQMDVAKGDPKVFYVGPKYELFPDWVIDNVLIAWARPTFGSTADELWGINLQSGARIWKYAIPGAGRLTYAELHSTTKGVFAVQCRADPDQCNWSSLDPQTGIVTDGGQNSFGGDSMQGVWDKDTLYLEGVGSHMNVIDAFNVRLLFTWP